MKLHPNGPAYWQALGTVLVIGLTMMAYLMAISILAPVFLEDLPEGVQILFVILHFLLFLHIPIMWIYAAIRKVQKQSHSEPTSGVTTP